VRESCKMIRKELLEFDFEDLLQIYDCREWNKNKEVNKKAMFRMVWAQALSSRERRLTNSFNKSYT